MGKELFFEEGYSFLELTNETGMKLVLSTYGAGLYECSINGVNMNYTPLSKADYASSLAYYGKTVGRIAGRIAKGELTLNGVTYSLSKNEKGDSQTLHGGKEGYSFKEWGYIEKENDEAYYVCFYLNSPHLDNGFPFEVKPGVVYVLYKHKNEFQIQLFAEVEEETPVNLTNHGYWNLGEEDILDAALYVRSKKVASYDDNLLFAGYEDPLPCLDFSKGKLLKEAVSDPAIFDTPLKGVDHNFLLDGVNSHVPSIILENGGKRMEIFTNCPAVQIYSDNYPNEDLVMASGKKDKINAALAIEPQCTGYLKDMMVKKGEPLAQLIDYRFYLEGEKDA